MSKIILLKGFGYTGSSVVKDYLKVDTSVYFYPKEFKILSILGRALSATGIKSVINTFVAMVLKNALVMKVTGGFRTTTHRFLSVDELLICTKFIRYTLFSNNSSEENISKSINDHFRDKTAVLLDQPFDNKLLGGKWKNYYKDAKCVVVLRNPLDQFVDREKKARLRLSNLRKKSKTDLCQQDLVYNFLNNLNKKLDLLHKDVVNENCKVVLFSEFVEDRTVRLKIDKYLELNGGIGVFNPSESKKNIGMGSSLNLNDKNQKLYNDTVNKIKNLKNV